MTTTATLTVDGVMYFGNLHPRNEDGLKWMCTKLQLPLKKIPNADAINQTPGKWLVISASALTPNQYPNKIVVSGPHFLPHELPSIYTTPYPIIVNALCPWVKTLFQTLRPKLPCICAPFPLDYESLAPTVPVADDALSNPKPNIIVYFKHRENKLLWQCVEELQRRYRSKYQVIWFIYGSYKRSEWLDELKKAKFAVFLIGTESQGFAVQEAMCYDVPIVMWDVNDLHHVHLGSAKSSSPAWFERDEYPASIPATGATLWNESCGLRVQQFEQFQQAIQEMEAHSDKFHPRPLILEHLNPETCLRRFLQAPDKGQTVAAVVDDEDDHRGNKYLVIRYSGKTWCGGLGDRFVGLVSAILLAKISNRSLLIDWQRPDMQGIWECLAPFTQDDERRCQSANGTRVMYWNCVDDRFKYANDLKTKHFNQLWPKRWVILECNQEIASFVYNNQDHYPELLEPNRFEQDMRNAYRSIFTSWFSMPTWTPFPGDQKHIGLQLRAGDVHMQCGNHVVFDEATLMQQVIPTCADFIKRLRPKHTTPVFVTSDVDCTKRIQECFTNQAIMMVGGPVRHLERQGQNSPDGLAKTLLDLYYLTFSSALIITWESNFGRLAALLAATRGQDTPDIFILTRDVHIYPLADIAWLWSKHSGPEPSMAIQDYGPATIIRNARNHNEPDMHLRGYDDGNWDTNGLTQVFQHFIHDSSTVMDIGACIGDFTNAVFVWHPNYHGRVYAFEPCKEAFQQYMNRFARDWRISARNIALGDVTDKGTTEILFVPEMVPYMASLFMRPVFRECLVEEVKVESVMDWFNVHAGPVHFIKINASGAEAAILKSMAPVLQSQRALCILFEYGDTWRSAKSTLKDAYDLLTSHGYAVFRVYGSGLIRVTAWSDNLETYQLSYYLTFPKRRYVFDQ